MPKAILEFTLPEDREAFDDAVKGEYYRYALEELRNVFRNKAKYTEDKVEWSEAYDLFLETMRDFRETMQETGG